jgi:hypothetical protein
MTCEPTLALGPQRIADPFEEQGSPRLALVYELMRPDCHEPGQIALPNVAVGRGRQGSTPDVWPGRGTLMLARILPDVGHARPPMTASSGKALTSGRREDYLPGASGMQVHSTLATIRMPIWKAFEPIFSRNEAFRADRFTFRVCPRSQLSSQ